jgi:hypothetical protein
MSPFTPTRCGSPLTAYHSHVHYSFMKVEHTDSAETSSAPRPSLADWPADDEHLEMYERHLLQLNRMNEIGITLIQGLDTAAATLTAAGKPIPATAPKAIRRLAREIRANRKLMAEIAESRKQRIAELGIVQH